MFTAALTSSLSDVREVGGRFSAWAAGLGEEEPLECLECLEEECPVEALAAGPLSFSCPLMKRSSVSCSSVGVEVTYEPPLNVALTLVVRNFTWRSGFVWEKETSLASLS